AYFGLMALAAMLGLMGTLFGERHEVYAIADDILLFVWMVQLLGLFGYVFRKRLLSAAIWRSLFPVFVLAFAAAVTVGAYRISLIRPISIASGLIVMVILALPIFFPLLLANRRYAFRSQDIWSADE